MGATIRLILLTAVRDRLLSGIVALLLVSAALSIFLGGTSLIEHVESAVVFAAGVGRLVLVLGFTVFAAFQIQGLLETREVEAILARAISRPVFIFSYWVGLTSLAGIVVALFSAAMVITGMASAPGALLWGATLFAECAIVLALTLFAGLMMERATIAVLFTLGFYALARLMGFFVAIRDTATDLSSGTIVIKHLLDVILLFVPRLDMFAQTRWLVYGVAGADLGFYAAQAALFVVLVLAAAVVDLNRKQF